MPQMWGRWACVLFTLVGVGVLQYLPQTAVHRRSIREEMNAFFLRDLVNTGLVLDAKIHLAFDKRSQHR